MQIFDYISDFRCGVGESPLWHASQQCWFWVDIPGKTIHAFTPATGQRRRWTAPQMVANLALFSDGSLLAALEDGLYQFKPDQAESSPFRLLASLPEAAPGLRFNDGRCDRQGRYWSGTMFTDMAAAKAIGKLYRYQSDTGLSAPIIDGLLTQNGLAWSGDGQTMYLSDSHPNSQLVWKFHYDCETGTPSQREVFIDLRNLPGRPDGAAVDTDNCYWICANDGGCIYRFTPAGKLDRTINLPMKKPAMCSFGGSDYRDLMITSICPDLNKADDWAGKTLILRPGAQGLAEATLT